MQTAEAPPLTCIHGHVMDERNALWKRDDRRGKAGGYWQCRTCRRESNKLSNRRRRSGEPPRRVAKRPPAARKWRGPRQLVNAAAEAVHFHGVSIPQAIEDYAPLVALARLRYTEWSPDFRATKRAEFEKRAAEEIMEAVERMAKDDSKRPWKYLQVKPVAEGAWDRFSAALEEARNSGKNLPNCQDKPAPYMDYDEDSPPTPEEAYELCYGCPLMDLCSIYAEQDRPSWGVWGGEVWLNGEPQT